MTKNIAKYKLVLGLEIHMHVKTAKKMFCGCSADIYTSKPNSQTCPTCLGLPGALPVPNKEAVEKVQLLGLALSCQVNESTYFDRKHYFYPDLPKGYQISQYMHPLCGEGELLLDSGAIAQIERIHLEEDTAKSFHQGGKTLIDFNKSGMPLLELVTKPTFTNVADAVNFCKKIRDLVRYLDISDANMEKGQLRIEPNISMRTAEMEANDQLPNYKVEIKNINSFRFMSKAVRAEIKRQTKLLDAEKEIHQENRGYDEKTKTTIPQRSKEEAHDYRYFPEPDIPPMEFSKEYFITLKASLPELPHEIYTRLIDKYNLTKSVARVLTSGDGLYLITQFEEIVNAGGNAKKTANLLLNRPAYQKLTTAQFIEKLQKTKTKITDREILEEIITTIIKGNPTLVESYEKGKVSVIEVLIGKAMKETAGKADACIARELFIEKLG
jgi:aspartyl-tRNA(Asn)/glutamyl-tRNA(Gln) amidotransferase subunit B